MSRLTELADRSGGEGGEVSDDKPTVGAIHQLTVEEQRTLRPSGKVIIDPVIRELYERLAALEADYSERIDTLNEYIAQLSAERDELLAALRAAVEVIKVWHDFGDRHCDKTWPIYRDKSPEMKPIMDAIAKVSP